MTNVAIVAPVWLQNALMVLLHAEPDLKLVACTATVQVLLSLDLEQSPDLVILEANEQLERAEEQLRRIKTAWPTSGCVALIEERRQSALIRAAGADEILLKGATPEQLLNAIRRLRQQHQGPAPNVSPEG